MNWAKINHLAECGLQVACQIGTRNIIFFGLVGSAVATKYIDIET